MIKEIHATTVFVSDQNAALEFYVGKLGWEIRTDYSMGPMRFLTVAPPGATTQLSLASAAYHGVKPGVGLALGEPGAGPQTGISLAVEGFDETYRTLQARGVAFATPPHVMPWGDTAVWLRDPDGNTFFMVGR